MEALRDDTISSGLTSEEAAARLRAIGPNEIPSEGRKSPLRIVVDVVREPMFLLLLACFLVYLILGDWAEAMMLLGFVAISIVITIYQENKTERSLEALRDLSSPRALVIREGKRQRIPGREVVPDDLVFLHEGDRVPADGVLLWCLNLQIDESILTGESVAASKIQNPEAPQMVAPGTENSSSVYSGTLVVAGQGVARVVATGVRTEFGKIGRKLADVSVEKTPLQKETGRLVRIFATLGISLSALLIVLYGLLKHEWLQGVLAGITLAMGLLPEEFPVILTVFLALGAWRISTQRVLTRKPGAIEALGSITTLCVDKTGTLTQNRMQLKALYVPPAEGKTGETVVLTANTTIPERFHSLIEFAVLASKRDPFDPMEKTLVELLETKRVDERHDHPDRILEKEYPLTKSLLVLSYAWRMSDDQRHLIGAKGAPEAILEIARLKPDEKVKALEAVEKLTNQGLRVLGVAEGTTEELPDDIRQIEFKWLGFIAWEDPLRVSVPEAVRECYEAGIDIKMITGDYPGTALAIAQQAGLRGNRVILGSDLSAQTEEETGMFVEQVNVFARMIPDQKYKLVQALQRNGKVVAMTGDGVNDAPSLKAAHVGIAMGERGTDVAREAASLVLLEDNFSHIISAIRMGRRIYDNLRKAMAYVVAIHVPIAGLSLLPVLLGFPLLLFPVHILFLEMIVDPACSLVFEQEQAESGVMKRPPRDPHSFIFSGGVLRLSLMEGFGVLAMTFATYYIALQQGLPADEARSLTFATLISANVALILSNRRWSDSMMTTVRQKNRAAWWIIVGTVLLLLVIYFIPAIRHLFKFGPMHGHDFLVAIAAGLLCALWSEALKRGLAGVKKKAI